MLIKAKDARREAFAARARIERDGHSLAAGLLRLPEGAVHADAGRAERLFLLIQGEVRVQCEEIDSVLRRTSCFDANPVCLHAAPGARVTVAAQSAAELYVAETDSGGRFPARLYTERDTVSEMRGQGTMRETSTRIVRTIMDYGSAPHAQFVCGEVVNYPGRWSSYPPHGHPQPEIYLYRFLPANGFGFGALGDAVHRVEQDDALLITDGLSHPQTAAPGYAMYYFWVIRRLDGNPYITPATEPQHAWVTAPDAPIWPPSGAHGQEGGAAV